MHRHQHKQQEAQKKNQGIMTPQKKHNFNNQPQRNGDL
jgi:hypothetical protein